jgi:hypothetical protein
VTRRAQRGDGVGIEYTQAVLRGVRLDHDEPDRVHSIADVPIHTPGEQHSTVDAFVRLRAELGNPVAPTRVGTFPPGASLQRIDATALTGPELNRRRADVEDTFGITSTMLIDDGPRRWLLTLDWDVDAIRTLEQFAERAGFVDVAIEPSPVAISRVLPGATTWIRRAATDGESFRLVLQSGVPVAAITDDTIGRVHPDVVLRSAPISTGLFDGQSEAGDLAALVQRISEGVSTDESGSAELVFGGQPYPPYPQHDIRSAERQCVALGAAVGAAGLAGRARPVDVLMPASTGGDTERPWAIESLSGLSDAPATTTMGAVKRATARVRPRRRPGGR